MNQLIECKTYISRPKKPSSIMDQFHSLLIKSEKKEEKKMRTFFFIRSGIQSSNQITVYFCLIKFNVTNQILFIFRIKSFSRGFTGENLCIFAISRNLKMFIIICMTIWHIMFTPFKEFQTKNVKKNQQQQQKNLSFSDKQKFIHQWNKDLATINHHQPSFEEQVIFLIFSFFPFYYKSSSPFFASARKLLF